MKPFDIIMRIVAALAVVAGIVYIVVAYGDKISAWAKKMFGKVSGQCCEGECACEGACVCESEACCEETPAEEVPAENEVQAEETDFEG